MNLRIDGTSNDVLFQIVKQGETKNACCMRGINQSTVHVRKGLFESTYYKWYMYQQLSEVVYIDVCVYSMFY